MIQTPKLEPSPSGSRRRTDPLFRFLPLLMGLCLAVLPTHAATRIWTGGHASSANWNLRDNWGGVAVPANGDTVVFPSGAARLVNTNNIAGLRLHEIQFLGLGGGYNVRGASLAVSNGITVAADAVNTLSVTSVTLHGSQALTVASGGQLTVNSDLVLSNANLTLAGAGDFSLRGGISGTGGVTKNGAGLATYFSEKDNTYRGLTTVNEGTLALYQRETISLVPLTVVSRIAVPGNLVVGDGTNAAVVRFSYEDQIANTATVTVLENAELRFYDNYDAFDNLVLRGGAVTMTTGTLMLNGDLTSLASASTASIGGLMLLNSDSTFTVADGLAIYDLEIAAHIGSSGGHGFTKNGPGTLRLLGTNNYNGATIIDEGSVRVATDSPFGQTFNGTTIAAGAELFIETTVDTLREPLTIAGAGIGGVSGAIRIGSGATIATNIVLSAPATIDTMGVGNLVIDGVISGTGPLTKIGPGTLELGGKSANTFSGELRAENGLLLLSKLAGSAMQGDLIIGTTNTSATARHTRSANLGGAVTLNGKCFYDLNGQNESIDRLTMLGGGQVDTGTGLLTVDSDIIALGSPINYGDACRITGRLRLGSASMATITLMPENTPPSIYGGSLFITASISGTASIVKNGHGTLGLHSSNSFTGSFTIAQGNVGLADDHALGSDAGDTIVVGDDSALFLNGGLNVQSERVFLSATGTNTSLYGGHLVSLSSNVWSGQIFLGQTALVNVPSNSQFNVTGVINGLAGLTKIGAGTLIYSGTASNTYIGTTRVNEGTLLLARSGPHNLSIPGALIVGDGLGGPEADVVETSETDPQIDNHAAVTVASSGLLRIRHQEEIGSLSGLGRVVVEGGLQLIVTDNGGSTTYDGAISGSGGLAKQGTGTLVLSGVNAYTGDTLIYGGTLVINGTQPSSDVYVGPSATLSGIGLIGALSIDGTLNPGNPLGPLRAESVNFLPGSTMIERIEARPQPGIFTPYGNNWFQSLSGPVDVTGAAVDISLGFPPSAGQEFKIGTTPGVLPPSGTFVGKPEGSLVMLNQIPFHLSYQGGSGNDIVLTVGELALRLVSARVEAGNGNGRIEPDECNDLFVVIENPTAAGVNVLNTYLQSLDNRIVVTQAESEYGSVPASSSRTNRTAFQIRSAPNYPCGANAEFHLVIETVGHGRFAIPITLPTGTPGSFQEFASAAGPAIIPDAGALNSQLPVTSSFLIGKVRVSLHATHPSAGQLRLKLISPQGVEVLLAEGEGGAGNNYGQSCERRTTFIDSAFISIATADAPFSGTFAPEGNLSDFVGLDSLGVWTLLAEDTVAGSLGALQCWTLELAPAECAPAGGGCDSCFATVNGALELGRTIPERLLGGYPTGCGDAPHCPTISSVWHAPYRYTTHTFTNTGPDACVTVMLTVPCAEPNRGLTSSAYLGDFDPANLCSNLLGHSGDDVEQGSGGFSFRVPAGERFTVVVNERNIYEAFQGCDTYALQLYGLPCPQEQPLLHIANDAGPDNVRLRWSTAYPGFDLQGKPNLGGNGVLSVFTNVHAAPVVIDGHYSVTNKHDGKGNGFFRLRKP